MIAMAGKCGLSNWKFRVDKYFWPTVGSERKDIAWHGHIDELRRTLQDAKQVTSITWRGHSTGSWWLFGREWAAINARGDRYDDIACCVREHRSRGKTW
jgi:hypothetical protein